MIHVGDLGKGHEIIMPQITNLELSGICNRECKKCPTKKFERFDRFRFMEKSLINYMLDRGDFSATKNLSLSMSGEPFLNKEIASITNAIKRNLPDISLRITTCMEDISEHKEMLNNFDYIIVNVDSWNNNSIIDSISNLAYINELSTLIVQYNDKKFPIWSDMNSKILDAVSGCVHIVEDPYKTLYEKPNILPVSYDTCHNPWLSVCVQTNGDVVPCSMCHGEDMVYGNLWKKSLKDIWNKSDVIRIMRNSMETKEYTEKCAMCYKRSPVFDIINRFGKGN